MPAASQVTVVINEFQASNGETIADEDGDFEDWIELYNHGSEPVLLGGYGLSDDEDRPFRWVLPDVSLGPGEFLLVFASNKDRTDGPFLHTNYAISSSGEELLLTAPDGTLIDFVPPTPVPRDVSFGRKPDGTGEWFFFDVPTPGTSNTTGPLEDLLAPPEFSHAGGFYTDAFTLTLSTSEPGAHIVYTLDGSEPREDNLDGTSYTFKNSYTQAPVDSAGPLLTGTYRSKRYEAPIAIMDRTGEPERLSQRSSTWHRSPNYLPLSPVFQGTVVRARTVREGSIASPVITHSYFVTPEGRGRYGLPVLALTVQSDHLHGFYEGIYTAGVDFEQWRAANPGESAQWTSRANYRRRGIEAEHPLHMEVMMPGEGRVWAQNLGVRIHGGASRFYPQKSLRIYARNAYDDTNTMSFPFIPGLVGQGTGEPITDFRRMILRNSGNDQRRTRLRDAFIQTLVAPLGLDQQGYEPVVHFINGEYWGIINIRERIDQHYISSHYDFDPDLVGIVTGESVVSAGNSDDRHDMEALRAYALSNDLSQPQHFAYMASRMDIDNFITYNMVQIFIKNTDWPGNNRMAWRKHIDREPGGPVHPGDGRWRWILFDTDFGFGTTAGLDASHDTLAYATHGMQWYRVKLVKLLENESFRTRFINAFADHMNTTFQPARVSELVAEMAGRIAPYFPEHHERWRNLASSDPSFLNHFAVDRPPHMRQHLMDYFGLAGTAEIRVHLPDGGAPGGGLRLNTLTLAPGEGQWEGVYFRGVPIELEAHPEPGYRFVRWDGVSGAPTSQTVTLIPEADMAITPVFEEDDSVYALFAAYHSTGQVNWPLPPMRIEARDSFGEIDTGFGGEVTISLETGPGTLGGTVTAVASEGTAVFDDLTVDLPGNYRFRSEAAGLVSQTTGPVAVAAISPVRIPRYIQGATPNDNRVPFAYRARIEGLMPNATYRYANRVVTLDEPSLQDGAGNSLLPAMDASGWRRNTNSPDFSDPSTYASFTADASGAYEGWFVTEPTGNRRFGEPEVRMRILLNDGDFGTDIHHYLTIPDPVTVLDFGESTSHGSALWAEGPFAPGNFVFLHGDPNANGRPLAGTVVEATDAEVDSRYAAFYQSFVAGNNHHWGTLIPNNMAGGVRRIEEYFWVGSEPVARYDSPDGKWPEDIDTANADWGGAAMALSLTDDDRTLEIALTGQVLDQDTLEPLPCGIVELTGEGNAFRITALTDWNGEYFVERQPAGVYSVRVFAPGYDTLVADMVTLNPESGAVEQDFLLSPVETGVTHIQGIVSKAPTGKALAGVWAQAFIVHLSGAAPTLIAETFTCADGYYELPLPSSAGQSMVLVELTMPGFSVAREVQAINFAQGAQVNMQMAPVFEGTAEITGVVRRLEAGQFAPASNARITLRGPVNTSTTADGDGAYAFGGLPHGNYSATASVSGFKAHIRQRTLTPGTSAPTDFALRSLQMLHGDVNGDGVVNAVDVQLVINAALGMTLEPAFLPDINGDGVVNAVDVQLVINAALGVAAGP